MMNYVWSAIVLTGAVYGVALGRGAEVSAAVFAGCEKALELAITLGGIAAFWGGLMRVAESAGCIDLLSRLLRPVLRALFPAARKRQDAQNAIASNIAANMLGVSNAATPLGLRAMGILRDMGPAARRDMATLVLVNTASVQILPATVVALRAAAGSQAPLAVMPAVWATSACTLACGLVALRLFSRRCAP